MDGMFGVQGTQRCITGGGRSDLLGEGGRVPRCGQVNVVLRTLYLPLPVADERLSGMVKEVGDG